MQFLVLYRLVSLSLWPYGWLSACCRCRSRLLVVWCHWLRTHFTKLKTNLVSGWPHLWFRPLYLGKPSHLRQGKQVDLKELQSQFQILRYRWSSLKVDWRYSSCSSHFAFVALASVAAQNWLYVLAFLDKEPFGKVDPVFGYDIGFYMFQLPALGFFQGVLSPWLSCVRLL